MNKKYLGLGICGILISVSALLCVIFMFTDSAGAYTLGMISGVFLISGLNLIFEGMKKVEGLEDTIKIAERDCKDV